MPSAYNPRSVLRQIPVDLLARFFSPFPEFADFDFSEFKTIEPVYERWQSMADPGRTQVGVSIRQIHFLSDSHGAVALIEACGDFDLAIAPVLGSMKNGCERAMFCLLNYPQAFQNARVLAHIDGLPKPSWEKRNGLPKRPITVSPCCLEKLGQEISAFFMKRESRGEKCTVEHRRRRSGVDTFFAYPADYANAIKGYNQDGDLAEIPLNGVFEVAYNYDSSAGTVELFARGGKPVRDVLAEKFARIILNECQQPKPYVEDAYDLSIFKDPGITFSPEPGGGLVAVRVKELRLQFHGKSRRVVVSVDGRNRDASVYDVIPDTLNEQRSRLADATVLGVTMQAIFRHSGSRDHVITFRLSATTCDLGDDPDEEFLKRQFKPWKIDKNA